MQPRAGNKVPNKSRVNADSPRDLGIGTEGARASADSPRGPGPVENAAVRMPNNSGATLDSGAQPRQHV